jgi:hypothetical protein
MSAVDDKVERGAEKLEELSRAAARAGGFKAKLAKPLAEDADFLRKLKPSLIAARARGRAPTDERPAPVAAPGVAQQPRRRSQPRQPGKPGGGPNPFAVIVAAFAVGAVLAHVLDWLGHRYPRA